jgi:type VI secretion system protein ImpL
MLRPQPSPGTTGYVIEIDGQKLSYRNGAAQWANFVWPNPNGTPGARIVATTFEGRIVEVINVPGRFGLEKMINSAKRTRQADGTFRLSWATDGVDIDVDLRIVSSAQAGNAQGGQGPRGLAGLRLPQTVAVGTVSAGAPVETAAASSPTSELATTTPASPPAAQGGKS